VKFACDGFTWATTELTINYTPLVVFLRARGKLAAPVIDIGTDVEKCRQNAKTLCERSTKRVEGLPPFIEPMIRRFNARRTSNELITVTQE
jgi:hypothetical protein